MSTIGFAIEQAGSINVKTVSPTKTAAKVNWLCVDCYLPLRNDITNAQIDQIFQRYAGERGASCIQVEIRKIAP